MNPENFPPHIKQLFQNRDLTMNQKMATLAAFMPDVPGMPEPDDHHELGMKIKHLVEDGKIRLGKFNKNFILEVETVA
jgi:hypothetical protein